MKFVFRLLIEWWRILDDVCVECGGELESHHNGKEYCEDCGTIN